MKHIFFTTLPLTIVSAATLLFGLTGCSSNSSENPPSIGITNPVSSDPLSGVTLENEAQNLGRIQAGGQTKPTLKR